MCQAVSAVSGLYEGVSPATHSPQPTTPSTATSVSKILRTVVVSMLVWNGATRFMWSSRSVSCSIRINGLEVAPWSEIVRTGVAGRCDCDRGVAFREAVTEVFTNRTLDGLYARQVVGLPVFD